MVPVYEATLGGPIVKDRLWFFGAARLLDDTRNNQTFATLINYDLKQKQRRYEGKLTWSLNRDHTLRTSYLRINEETQNDAFTPIMDLDSLYGTRSDPQSLISAHYTGVVSPSFFVEAQYSRRDLEFSGNGSQFTDLVRGTLLIDRSRGPNARYNSPTFCAVCGDPEQRDNQNVLLKATYFASTGRLGSHQIVGGVDAFNDQRFADNFQSGSDYRIFGTRSIVQGREHLPRVRERRVHLPALEPDLRRQRGHELPDQLRVRERRLEGEPPLHVQPRPALRPQRRRGQRGQRGGQGLRGEPALLGRRFDPGGDGAWTLNGGVAKYVAAIANSLADGASQGGRSAQLDYAYLGPAINTDPGAAAPHRGAGR